jgi:hypothetical protein
LLFLAVIPPAAFAQQLPPPREPAGGEVETRAQGPALVPPQNASQQAEQNAQQQAEQKVLQQPAQNAAQQPAGPPVGAQAANQKAGQVVDLKMARWRAENERKQARFDRMMQFKAARAAEEQKLYQDWHERYLADTPVRVEYYRALGTAYASQPALAYYQAPYFFGAGPAVVLPPVYAPVVYAPIYGPHCGGFFCWGW